MKKYIFVFGPIAGLFVICSMIIGIVASDGEGAAAGEAFGYLIMLVALSLIFIAIKQYRDKELGGIITFGKGVALGLGISAVAAVAYVIVWEFYLSITDYAFIDQYIAGQLKQVAEAVGTSASEYAAKVAEMDAMKVTYANPLFRLPMTMLEIFPVGALVTLVSAGILRNQKVLPARG